MPNLLDIYGDKSLRGLAGITHKYPEYYDQIKDTEVDYDNIDQLPESAFAYPEERAYPIHNKEMALLSALYNNEYPVDGLPEHVTENFKKASYLYDFELPQAKPVSVVKEAALTEEDYLLPSLKKFPVRNVNDVNLVQTIMVKNASQMGYDHLMEASNNLVKKASTLNMSLDSIHPVVLKYAGYTKSNKEVLEAVIAGRAKYASENKDISEAYLKLASAINDMDFNRENLLKVAATLETLDDTANIRHLYDKTILNPIDSVFNTDKRVTLQMDKIASDITFTPDHAQRVSEEQVKSILGHDVLDEARNVDGTLDRDKLIEVVNSLPSDMVKDFVERT